MISPSFKVGWFLTLPTMLPLSRSCQSFKVVISKDVEMRWDVAGRGVVNASTWERAPRRAKIAVAENLMVTEELLLNVCMSNSVCGRRECLLLFLSFLLSSLVCQQ
jgi:hypothetical protein